MIKYLFEPEFLLYMNITNREENRWIFILWTAQLLVQTLFIRRQIPLVSNGITVGIRHHTFPRSWCMRFSHSKEIQTESLTFTRDIDVSQGVHDIFSHLLLYTCQLVILQIQRFQGVQILENQRRQYLDSRDKLGRKRRERLWLRW